ncbi:MAG: glycosyltransferase [Polyangiaceae bacterium]
MPELTRIAPAADQDIDVLFYGSISPRRRRLLEALARRGLDVVEVFACYGRQRDELIARAKVVLNVHFFDRGIFEMVRVSYLWANKVCVVCEDGRASEAFKDALPVVPYQELVETCVSMVRNPSARRTAAELGFAVMKSRPEATILSEALDSLKVESKETVRTVTAPRDSGRVSLCVLARDEMGALAACIDSAAHLVCDRVVVVAEGASGRTREIARLHGASVVDAGANDNLGSACAKAVAQASGDWVLWLEDDEWLDGANRARLTTLFGRLSHEATAYVMQCVLVSPEDEWVIATDQPRLFRRDSNVGWDPLVHERIIPSVRRGGGHVRASDVVIFGRALTGDARFRRLEHELRLLDVECDRGPDHYVLLRRGAALLELGRSAEALVALHACRAYSQREFGVAPRLCALIVRAYFEEGCIADALEALCRARSVYPDDIELSLLDAEFVAAAGEVHAASGHLEQLLSRPELARPAGAVATLCALRAERLLAQLRPLHQPQ